MQRHGCQPKVLVDHHNPQAVWQHDPVAPPMRVVHAAISLQLFRQVPEFPLAISLLFEHLVRIVDFTEKMVLSPRIELGQIPIKSMK